MQTIYVIEGRQYEIANDRLWCSWAVQYLEGDNETKMLVSRQLGDPSKMLSGLAELVEAWEKAGRPKTVLLPNPYKGLGRRLAVTVQGHFIRSIEELPD